MASVFVLTAVFVAPAVGAEREEVTTFAMVPEPGHPFGALPGDGVVYVTSAGGNPTTINSKRQEKLFTYDFQGRLIDSKPVDVLNTNMGLFDLARDAEGRLYVGDMNGRVLRFQVGKDGKPVGEPEVYATAPPPEALGAWYTAMWNGLAFDRKGNLYVSDSQTAAIWRIPPNGEAELYFRDPRLVGGAPGGPFGATLSPDGEHLFVTVIGSGLPTNMNDGIVYKLRLAERPTADDLETFHVFKPTAEKPLPGSMDVAFGESGLVYVVLGYAYEMAVLSPDGKQEIRRIRSPLFATPSAHHWHGRSLLVPNADFAPEDRDKWRILSVWVGERGVLPLEPSVDSPPSS